MKQFSDFNFGDDAHIDLTPLIDVIFMLVIFFILTSKIDWFLNFKSRRCTKHNKIPPLLFGAYYNKKKEKMQEKNANGILSGTT